MIADVTKYMRLWLMISLKLKL